MEEEEEGILLVEVLLLIIVEDRGTILVVMVMEGTSPLMMEEVGAIKGDREEKCDEERGRGIECDIVDNV